MCLPPPPQIHTATILPHKHNNVLPLTSIPMFVTTMSSPPKFTCFINTGNLLRTDVMPCVQEKMLHRLIGLDINRLGSPAPGRRPGLITAAAVRLPPSMCRAGVSRLPYPNPSPLAELTGHPVTLDLPYPEWPRSGTGLSGRWMGVAPLRPQLTLPPFILVQPNTHHPSVPPVPLTPPHPVLPRLLSEPTPPPGMKGSWRLSPPPPRLAGQSWR